jgi:hypothetical protein
MLRPTRASISRAASTRISPRRRDYRSPLGLLGRLADKLFLERYLRRFLTERAIFLKTAAESST